MDWFTFSALGTGAEGSIAICGATKNPIPSAVPKPPLGEYFAAFPNSSKMQSNALVVPLDEKLTALFPEDEKLTVLRL